MLRHGVRHLLVLTTVLSLLPAALPCPCSAPVHSFRHTRRAVEAAFGKPLRELFESFDPKPLASGSIAQVHRATLRRHAPTAANPAAQQAAAADEDELTQVVVKVCHPNVHRHICLDFRLLAGLSAAAARVPALRGLSLRESVAQFSHTMTAQTDLRVEGVHALRFSNNFSGAAAAAASAAVACGTVLHWACLLMGLPADGGGVFVQLG